MRALRLRAEIGAGDLSRTPRSGGVLVVANYPSGIVDGLMIGHLIASRLRDVKLAVNSQLCQAPEARRMLLPVDFGHTMSARLATRPGLRTLPICVHGQNSRLFQTVSHFSYPLRMAMIFCETLRKRGHPVRVVVAAPINCPAMDQAKVVSRLRRITHDAAGPGGPSAEVAYIWPERVIWQGLPAVWRQLRLCRGLARGQPKV